MIVVVSALVGASCTSNTSAAEGELRAEIRDAPPEQRAALDDGLVSFEEYDEATDQVVQCIQGTGLDASAELRTTGVPGQPQLFSITVALGSTEEEAQTTQSLADEVYDQCYERFASVISAVYEADNTDRRLIDDFVEDQS